MKRVLAAVVCLVMVLALCACGSEAGDDKKELTSVGKYDKSVLELGDATIVTNDGGEKVVKVSATYSNNDTEPLYAYCSFAVRAFQNDVQLDEVSDINGDEAALIKEVKNGASVEVTYLFKMKADGPVEVLIGEPTADQATVGKKVYFDSNN